MRLEIVVAGLLGALMIGAVVATVAARSAQASPAADPGATLVEGPSGEVNVAGIAEAVDNTELSTLAKSVRERRSDDFVRAYDETLTACYACHRAIGKPYLRPHRPTSPEARIIDFRMR